jgi:hypothetical protein
MEFYADWANDCSGLACGVANLGGSLTSLATRKNLGDAAMAIVPGRGCAFMGVAALKGADEAAALARALQGGRRAFELSRPYGSTRSWTTPATSSR